MMAISRTGRLLRSLVRASCRRPVLTVWLSLVLALTGTAYTVQGLRFKTSGRDVLPRDAGYVLRYVEYTREFGELEDIVVVVEAPSFEAAKDYASRLVQELRHSSVQFPRASSSSTCPRPSCARSATRSSTTRSSWRASPPTRASPSSWKG